MEKGHVGLIQRFLTHLQEERHFSENTAKCYSNDLTQYYAFLTRGDGGSGDTLAVDVDRASIVIFIFKLKGLNYRGGSIARKVATLRSFYKWMFRCGIIRESPMSDIPPIRQLKRVPQTITHEQMMALLGMPDATNFLGARDLAIIQMICSTGLRIEELNALNCDNVDFEGPSPCVYIDGKGHRTQDLDTASIVALRRYMSFRVVMREYDPTPLFINKHGKRLSGRSVRRKLDKYLEMAGIDVTISPSVLRHTYASRLVASGIKPVEVATKLGHIGHTGSTVKVMYRSFTPPKPPPVAEYEE